MVIVEKILLKLRIPRGALCFMAPFFCSAAIADNHGNDTDRFLELIACQLQMIDSEIKSGRDSEDLNALTLIGEQLELKTDYGANTPTIASLCEEQHKSKYEPSHLGSYAMGISFHNKVLGEREYSHLNWVDFVNGLLRAKSDSVTTPQADLDKELKRTLDPVEASIQHLEATQKDGSYKDISGVFYKKLGASDKTSTEFNCNFGSEEEKDYYVSYHRVDPIDGEHLVDEGATPLDEYAKLLKNEDKSICIGFDKKEVIRGWGILVGKLSADAIYDVVIPSDLAYGPNGTTDVAGGQNLRFIMRLHGNTDPETMGNRVEGQINEPE